MTREEYIRVTAEEYLAAVHTPGDESYRVFVQETLGQWERLKGEGWELVRVHSSDTYLDSRAMLRDISRRCLRVDTGGQSMAIGHPLAYRVGDWSINEIFRAVHDVFGHGAHNGGSVCDFETFEGECQAYLNHRRSYSSWACPALHGETMGQLAHYFSGLGFVQVQEAKIIPVRNEIIETLNPTSQPGR